MFLGSLQRLIFLLKNGYYNTGRETFLLPVNWKKGWPIILPGEKEVPYVHERPNLERQDPSDIPTSGNFTNRDDFEHKSLGHYWSFIRTPYEKWYDLKSSSGKLTIKARQIPLGAHQQLSFIGRRQQHSRAVASTLMNYKPKNNGDKAGIAAFQNDDFYYLMTVTLKDEKEIIQLEKRAGDQTGGKSKLVAMTQLGEDFKGNLYLKIEADGDRYSFYYGCEKDRWRLLKGEADGTILSTEVAGGFVGTVFGMYAYSPQVINY